MNRFLLLLVLISSCVGGCVSEDRRLSSLPVEQRTLFLQNFGNTTFEGDMHGELTEALRSHIDQRRGYILVSEQEKARYLLFGEIILYRREGHLFDNEYNPLRYDLNVVVRIRLLERESGRTMAAFEEDARTQYSVSEGMAEDETGARRRLYASLSRKIYSRISEAFPL